MNNSLISQLLENNLESNNYRTWQAITILLILIIPVTSFMKLKGWTSEAMTVESIVGVTVLSSVILLVLYRVIQRYGKHSWTKWLMIIAIFSIFVSFRTIAYNAIETHAIFYLTIILAVFYFDYKLVLFATVLCIVGDYFLLLLHPPSIPPGVSAVGQGIRYLDYLWAGLAAALGTRAMRQLLVLSTELKTANDRLQEDIEKERQLERVLKDFIAAVSHELKTPLGIVQGYAEAVRDSINPHKQQEYMNIIVDETKNMGGLITNMLDLSQLENGFVVLHQHEFCLDDLTDQVLQRFEIIIAEKGLKVSIVRDYNSLWVYGDEAKIALCLVNLISNALQQTLEHGGIKVTYADQEDQVVFSIVNEGHIDPEDLDKIWLPFYRTEKSRSKEHGGTGLGLTITRHILDLHGSSYGVENTDQGVRFYFSLLKRKALGVIQPNIMDIPTHLN